MNGTDTNPPAATRYADDFVHMCNMYGNIDELIACLQKARAAGKKTYSIWYSAPEKTLNTEVMLHCE